MLTKKKVFGLPIAMALMAVAISAAALVGNATNAPPAEAHPAQYHISKGEWKSYWVWPSPEPISVYYHPKAGDAPTQLDARVGFWIPSRDTDFPDVTVDVYVSSGTPGKEGWGFVDRLYINEASNGDKSFPLWVGQGATYKFDIKRKWTVNWTYARIVLGVQSVD